VGCRYGAGAGLLGGHDAALTAFAFHPDGEVLVSGSSDGTMKLWDLPYIHKELADMGLDW
jgi:WD40 repeat protein